MFDESLDPKKYMDWKVGLEEYFDWYQLPEGRQIQFAQMKLTGLAKFTGHSSATARDAGHHMGGDEKPIAREVQPGMLSTYDH